MSEVTSQSPALTAASKHATPSAVEASGQSQRGTGLSSGWHVIRRPTVIIGGVCVGIWVLAAVIAPLLASYSPTAVNIAPALQAPSAAHWFGTDAVGRDVFSRVVYGGRTTLVTGFVAVTISAVIGVPLGAIAGYYPGWRRGLIMRVIDVLFAFPELILAMGIAAALGAGISSLLIAVSVVGIPAFARIMFTLTVSLREREFIQAARVSGTGNTSILFSHILPNALGPLLVQFTLSLGFATLTTAALSFIGLGAQPPSPEWGLQISDGRDYILSGQWWVTAFPGLAIAMCVFGFNLIGDGLRDHFDPRSR